MLTEAGTRRRAADARVLGVAVGAGTGSLKEEKPLAEWFPIPDVEEYGDDGQPVGGIPAPSALHDDERWW